MSYNVAICLPPVAVDDQTAWAELNAMIGEKGQVPDALQQLHDRLTARWPCICSLPDDEADDGVWSDGPLINNFGQRAAVLGMVYSRVGEVLPLLIERANSMGMVVFDWATQTIYRPSETHKTTVSAERKKPWWRFW
jgi:hypothetical protein